MKLFKKNYYEQLFAKKEKTVEDYQLIIAHAQQKITELQAACKHKEIEPVMFMSRPGAFHASRACKSCHAVVSEATKEESDKLWAQWGHGSENL
jgi:hypothetical protein